VKGLIVLAIGLTAVVAGFVAFFAVGPIGLLLLLAGAPFLMYVFGIDGAINTPGRAGYGKESYMREEIRESEAEEERERGESD